MKSTYLLSFALLCTSTLFGAASSSSTQNVQMRPKPIPALQEFALRTIIKDITQTALQNIQTPDDLHALIASSISAKQLKELHSMGLDKTIFNRLANILAKDYFLKLSAKKEERKPELLPEWLREHFTGVSIQDLLDYGTYFESLVNDVWLDLSKMYINDLTGLKNIPNIGTIEWLMLGQNLITTIEPGVFASLPQLQSLRLNDNRITTIEPGVFAGLPNLSVIDLGHNQITTIAPTTFAGLPNLSVIDLGHNQITTIAPTTFAGLPNLSLIILSHNQITTIALTTFADLPQRSLFIWLQNNPIAQSQEARTRIEEEVRIATAGFGNITWGNPW